MSVWSTENSLFMSVALRGTFRPGKLTPGSPGSSPHCADKLLFGQLLLGALCSIFRSLFSHSHPVRCMHRVWLLTAAHVALQEEGVARVSPFCLCQRFPRER